MADRRWGMWQCLHSTRAAGVSFDGSHQGQMGQESFLCSHSLGLLHPVQDVWGNSEPAGEGWGLLGLCHSCFLLHLNTFLGSVRHVHGQTLESSCLGHIFLRNRDYPWYTSTFLKCKFLSCGSSLLLFGFQYLQGADPLWGSKPCCLGSTEDEQGARDIQCFLAVMFISS